MRRRKNNILKGPAFDSFKYPQGPSGNSRHVTPAGLQEGQAYKPHTGRAARLRYLRRICKPMLTSTLPADMAAVARVEQMTSGEPNPEYSKLYLLNRTRERAEDTGLPWAEATEITLDFFSNLIAEAEAKKVVAPTSEDASDAQLPVAEAQHA